VPLVVALIAVPVLGLLWQFTPFPGSIDWRARQALRRLRAQRNKASTVELLVEARRAVQFERWERFPAGKTLVTDEIHSDARLREVIRKLFTEVTEEDRERNRDGRDGNYFEFYDSGLAMLLEVLEDRLKVAPRAADEP
jgi:hypothetical protein